MSEIAGLVAVLGCTLFAGAAIYVTLVEHPARLACGTELAATEFVPSYRRAAAMQAGLALVASAAGLVRWGTTGGGLWLWGALCMFSVIPFTLVVILPTNKRLLDPALDRASTEARALLDTWGRLHAVRSLLGLIASLLLGTALGRP